MSLDSITCPDCGMTSHHPEDVKWGYCGNCHRFTSPVWQGDRLLTPEERDMPHRTDALRRMGYSVWNRPTPERKWPWWADVPYPHVEPMWIDRIMLRFHAWLRRINGKPT